MKYVTLFCHGLADAPVADLGGRTPFELAKTPNLDRLAKEGRMGTASFVPASLPVSPDVACFSILGYDPQQYYTGLAPLDALALGVPQDDRAVAFRADLVTVFDDIFQDPMAGRISAKEAGPLLEELVKHISTDRIKLYPGDGHKNILIVRDDALADDLDELDTTEPLKLTGQNFTKSLPKGRSESVITSLMKKSREVFEAHEINRVRIDLGENPASMLWLWGQGRRPKLPPFFERHGLRGATVSKKDYVKGLGLAAGFEAHADDVASALKDADFVFSYSAPAAASPELKARVKRIEDFDQEVGQALAALAGEKDVRVLAGTDSGFSVSTSRPEHAETPFVVWGKGVEASGAAGFSEKTAALGKVTLPEGYELINHFIVKGKQAS